MDKTIQRYLFQTELTLQCIPEDLDRASIEAVEAFRREELSVEAMHAILVPLRRVFSRLTVVHEYVVYLAEEFEVELHKGPEVFLKILGNGPLDERIANFLKKDDQFGN